MHHTDGSVTRGESTPRDPRRAVRRLTVEPEGAVAPAAVIEAIARADLVVLSSGSLFTSTIPSLLGWGTSRALADFAGPVIYVANIMTQPGETLGFTLSDHLRAIFEHVGPVVTDVLVHSEELPAHLLARYDGEGAQQVQVDREEIERLGVPLHFAQLLPDPIGVVARHEPHRLARALLEVAARRKTASAYDS
jgi:uncharacterized cofD-like protein